MRPEILRISKESIFVRYSTMGSIVLPHLRTAWHVDQAILSEEERLVVIRFGRDHDPDCELKSISSPSIAAFHQS